MLPKGKSPAKLYQFQTRQERIDYVQDFCQVSLNKTNNTFADDDNISNVHCENLIGGISLPVGLAGPLKILGTDFEGDFWIPLATSEGALIASTSRGAKAINESRGALTHVVRAGVTRAPVFETSSLQKSYNFEKWLNINEERIKQVAESTSSHLKFLGVDIKVLNKYVYTRFYFDSEDAMGMNMATIACQKIADFVQEQEELNVTCITVSGNYCVDKKPAWVNFINNRGFSVQAEVILPSEVVKKVLKVSPKAMDKVWRSKIMLGSAMAGSMGFNAHFANIVAAFFAATGQDLAQVVEGSMGITNLEILDNNDLYFGIHMPAVMIATVGGGTKLNTQREMLKLLKLEKSYQLAQVLGASVLAGEISLIASQAEGSLADSHKKLGR